MTHSSAVDTGARYWLESRPMYLPSSTLQNVHPALLPSTTQDISATLTEESTVRVSSLLTVTATGSR